jgi:pre-rRNA-processing protein TSR2
MLTRSKSSAQARFERRYQAALQKYSQECIESFNTGINAILHQWTALELAVYHRWGGPASVEQVECLQYELFELFLAPDKVYRDDVSLILEDYLETQFNTICEDGSPEEIGELLCLLWSECISGNFGRVNMLVDRLAQRRREEILQQSQGLAKGDEEDSDDDMEGMDGVQNPESLIQEALAASGVLSSITEGNEDDEDEIAPPLVDADGFQTVVNQKKGKRSGSKQTSSRVVEATPSTIGSTVVPQFSGYSKNNKKANAIAAAAALAMSLAEDGIIGPGASNTTTVFSGTDTLAADAAMDEN